MIIVYEGIYIFLCYLKIFFLLSIVTHLLNLINNASKSSVTTSLEQNLLRLKLFFIWWKDNSPRKLNLTNKGNIYTLMVFMAICGLCVGVIFHKYQTNSSIV